MAQRMNFKNGRGSRRASPTGHESADFLRSSSVVRSAAPSRRIGYSTSPPPICRSSGNPSKTIPAESIPRWEFARDQLSDPGENAPIKRTNDAQATLGKIDWNANSKNFVTFRYNFSNSRQNNGTFDVAPYGASANAIEKDHSNTVNGSVNTTISAAMLNEFRIQFSREDRPRDYSGPTPDIQGSAIRCDIMPLCG
jgi:hypothetical protein